MRRRLQDALYRRRDAIKHGRRETAITITRDWGDQLRIAVTNHAEPGANAPEPSSGNGIDGMRRRLASVGGSLRVHAAAEPGAVFVASASLPLRAGRLVGTVGA